MPARAGTVRAALVAVLTLLVLTGCSWRGGSGAVSDLGAADDDGYRGAYLGDEAHPVPSVDLVDEAGQPVDLRTETRRSMVFLGFTRCTTICPVVLSTLAKALDRLDASERDAVQVLFVTTDPDHDTAPVLRRALARFDPSFRGVTGDPADVRGLADALHVPLDEGRGTVVASVADGRADLLWTRATTPTEMAEDLRRVLAEDR